MGAWRSWVRERDKIYRYVADDSLLVKDVSYAFAYGHHVHVGQRLLREEAACVDISSGSESVHRTDDLYLTIRLNQKPRF